MGGSWSEREHQGLPSKILVNKSCGKVKYSFSSIHGQGTFLEYNQCLKLFKVTTYIHIVTTVLVIILLSK